MTSLDRHARVLESMDGVSAWVLRKVRSREAQRYIIFDRPEADRAVDESTLKVTLFHTGKDGQGEASFTLPGANVELTPGRIEEALFAAGLASNPPYVLPGPQPMPAVAAFDPVLAVGDGNGKRALDTIAERVHAAAAGEKQVRLSTCEIFISRNETELLSASGVEAASEGSFAFLDLVLLARDGDREAEAHEGIAARRLADLDIERMVRDLAQQARDSLHGQAPETRRGPVVMSNGAFLPLLEPFRSATSGAALYRKQSPLVVGKSVFGERQVRGDAMSLASDATLPFGAETTPFDEEGLALRRVPVIEAGQFKEPAAAKRYADYLKLRATGDWHNAVLAAGSRPESQLLAPSGGPLLHIVEFSWLNPDNVTGNFSTEIRLAYELGGPKGTRIIKGGSLSGNVYEAFAAAHYSTETELREHFHGPRTIRFEDLQITGA
jgi:predicted Zn-dependent protease